MASVPTGQIKATTPNTIATRLRINSPRRISLNSSIVLLLTHESVIPILTDPAESVMEANPLRTD